MAEGGVDLSELPDGVADLPVEDAAIGDDDDRVKHLGAVVFEPDELMGEPGDGVALAAAGGMLHQVALARPMLRGMIEQLPHHVELVVAGKDLHAPLLAGLVVSLLGHLRVAFEDVGESR